MENCEALRSTHSFVYRLYKKCFVENSKISYLPYFVSDLYQIFTVIFQMFLLLNQLKPGLDPYPLNAL